jgi:hypothetical protein
MRDLSPDMVWQPLRQMLGNRPFRMAGEAK